MPQECRAKCSGCAGKGCAICEGRGLVCPVCLGMRFLRKEVHTGHEDFGKVFRCEGCCEGNNVSPEREIRTVRTYLRGFIPARSDLQGVGQ